VSPRLHWEIEHECPQCGAPVTLKEGDRILTCNFCRTRLYLVARHMFRYYLPSADARSDEMFFFPYHRIRGLSFSIGLDGIQARYVDMSHRLFNVPNLPLSLGVRPQAMTLRLVEPQMEGKFVMPSSGSPFLKQEKLPGERFIGETESIIYLPTYVRDGRLYDGLLARPLAVWDASSFLVFEACPPCEIRYLATLCPNCGGDLEGKGEAVALTCPNCQTAWICKEGRLLPLSFGLWQVADEVVYWLPFWQLKVNISGLSLDSHPALLEFANLPPRTEKNSKEDGLYFWAPAFKLNPEHFLRWARQMTIFQPRVSLTIHLRGKSLYPATLPVEEALEIIPVMLAELVKNKQAFIEKTLPGLMVDLKEVTLVYHPFRERKGELVHQSMGLVIQRNALEFGFHL